MKILLLASLFFVQACEPCDTKDDEEAIQCLNTLPSRNLYSSAEALDYLSKHKVYLTVSTSPSRLKTLSQTLRTLDLTHIEKIFLSLPEKYRNTEDYGKIPEEVLNFPKLELIARDQKDLGPIMKMLPAVKKIALTDPNALVISIDDDVGFPKGAVNELIYHAILNPNAVITGAGSYGGLFGILPEEWPFGDSEKRRPFCGVGEFSFCDFVEGWRGVAYRPKLVNTSRMKEYAKLSKACKTSDDLVISYVLSESRVPKIRITNRNYYFVRQFDYRSDGNALHKIHLDTPGWQARSTTESLVAGTTNSERYQRCVLDIIEYKSKIKNSP